MKITASGFNWSSSGWGTSQTYCGKYGLSGRHRPTMTLCLENRGFDGSHRIYLGCLVLPVNIHRRRLQKSCYSSGVPTMSTHSCFRTASLPAHGELTAIVTRNDAPLLRLCDEIVSARIETNAHRSNPSYEYHNRFGGFAKGVTGVHISM